MGIEIVGFEAVQGPVGTLTEGANSAKENGKLDQGPEVNEPIKFGSHGDESAKKEVNEVSVSNFPKDAVSEWPAPKQTHYIPFVKYRLYDDPKIKAKRDHVNKEFENWNNAQFRITEALNAKKACRTELINQIKVLREDNRQIRSIVDEKFKDLKPLQQALGQLRSADNASRSGFLCSSEEELNSRIQGLQYIIQHESIPLKEEKKILKDIRQLESTRLQVIAHAATLAELAPKETLQNQVKLMGGDLDGVKKEQQAVRSKIKQLDDAVKAIDEELLSLQNERSFLTEKKAKASESINQLNKQGHEGNACYYKYRTLLTKANALAAKHDVKGVQKLAHAEGEEFMSHWNSNKDFRDAYEKRNLKYLDFRQLSRDGRLRNPDEQPLVVVEASGSPVVETVSKASAKQGREDSRSAPADTLPVQKVEKEAKNKTTVPKSTEEHIDMAENEIFEVEKQTKDSSLKDNKVDAAKLKEMKRGEEIEKNKQALERKKKKAEKDAAKAAIRAQKEAEKKEKKKAKKKGSSAPETNPEEPTEPVAEAADAEPEKVNENVDAPVTAKPKVQKDNNLRSRGRPRGPDSLPKAILKRKKSSTNYWLWAAPAALLVLLFLALSYRYLL